MTLTQEQMNAKTQIGVLLNGIEASADHHIRENIDEKTWDVVKKKVTGIRAFLTVFG